jgi:hypothetical protein
MVRRDAAFDRLKLDLKRREIDGEDSRHKSIKEEGR